MRSYPRRVYKGKDVSILVNNETEEYQACLNGYESSWKPEIIEKRKGTDREILKTLPVVIDDGAEKIVLEPEEGKFEEIDTVEKLEETIPELSELPDLPSVDEQYRNATGKKAVCDRGPYKGKETKDFIKWKKDHGNL